MYWILLVMGLLVAIVAAVLVGGLVTPRRHTVSRSIVVPTDTQDVWNIIRDIARYPAWRDDMIDAELVAGYGGLAWREISSSGTVSYAVVEEDAPTRMTAKTLDEDAPFSGVWSWTLEKLETGTRVTLAQMGEVGNPLIRFVRSIRGYHRDIDAYLQALRRHCNAAHGL